MKTYILSNLNRIAKYSKELDAKAILYNKNWEVFNEDNEKEVLIFRPKGELLIVRKGIVTKSSWELLPTGSILITTDSTTFLFNAAFVDTNVLALQLDGTNECMVMLESEAKKDLLLDSIKKVDTYLENKYTPKKDIDQKDFYQPTPEDNTSDGCFTAAIFIAVGVTILFVIVVLASV